MTLNRIRDDLGRVLASFLRFLNAQVYPVHLLVPAQDPSCTSRSACMAD
jgi:hypothetical protein